MAGIFFYPEGVIGERVENISYIAFNLSLMGFGPREQNWEGKHLHHLRLYGN